MPQDEQNLPSSQFLSRVLNSSFWMFNSSILVRALNLLRGIVLARLLIPEDFGLFGLASIVIGFTTIFSDIGAGSFLMYKHKSKDEDIDTAFWVNLVTATLLSVGIVFLSPLVSKFYNESRLIPVLVVLASALWFQIISNIHRNLLRRELKLRSIAFVDALVSIVVFVIAILLALRGSGVWAFVFSTLTGNIVNVLLLWYASRWLPKWRFSLGSFKVLMPFSSWYLGQAVVWYFILNMDNLLVGKFLGMNELGIYTLAYNYALMPVTLVANSLGNVTIPELARLKPGSLEFWDAFYKVSRILVGSVCPIACTLIITAPDLFPLLFGSKWNSAILPFQIIALYGIVRCLWVDPFSALGNFKLSFWFGLIANILCFVGIYLGLHYGIIGVAWAVLIVIGCVHILALYVGSNSIARFFEGIKNAIPFLLGAVSATLVAVFVRHLFLFFVSDRKELLVLVSTVTLFLVYGIVFKRYLLEIFALITKRVSREPL